METNMERLIDILKKYCPDVDFETEQALIEDGIISSLDMVNIVIDIDTEFDVRIPPEEIVPENFNSAEAIMALINTLDED